MTRLVIGPIDLPVTLRAEELRRAVVGHVERLVGSRADFAWNEQRWESISLEARVVGEETVVLCTPSRSGGLAPIGKGELPPGGSDEIALGFVLGRLLCRGIVTIDTIRSAPALPNGRFLTELRGVEIAAMPEALHRALGELHVIGFTGMPEGPPGVPLWIEGGPVLPTHEPSAEELRAEVAEILARMAEKFRLSPRGPSRYGEPSLHPSIVPVSALPRGSGAEAALAGSSAEEAVRIAADTWARGYPDLPLLQWILAHLLRPRRRHPFLPLRSLLVLPRSIPRAIPLPTGDHLADLPAIRHQLMPTKIASVLGDLHRRVADPLGAPGNSMHSTGTPSGPEAPTQEGLTVELRFGPIRIATNRVDRDAMLAESRQAVIPLIEVFRREGGGEAKFGAVTLAIEPRGDRTIDFVSAEFLPGCPDEILCEFLVASWLRNGSIPLSAVSHARRIGRRTVVAAPTIQRQLAPAGTIELVEAIHSGQTGPDRTTSGWRPQIE